MAAKLSVVPDDKPEKVSTDAMWRDEAKAIDWKRVHIEADRRDPIMLTMLRKVHRL